MHHDLYQRSLRRYEVDMNECDDDEDEDGDDVRGVGTSE
jgi:hypothetical protein